MSPLPAPLVATVTWELHRHDARHLSELLAPESVDLIVTSPPYFALRSYRDTVYSVVHPDGTVEAFQEHYDGQLGSEATPGEFVDNLVACTADWLKVLKPTGSLFVNLSDKFAGSGGNNQSGLRDPRLEAATVTATGFRGGPRRYNQAADGVRAKSRMGLPWRYALRCIDELGLILRADIIWAKPNGLPESVTDRVRISHEYLFHFVRQGRYFAAIDEVREGYSPGGDGLLRADTDPLGKVPGSVWQIPSEPLQVPDSLGVDHFAAYPSELVRRIILGWTPTGFCTRCGEARRAVVDKTNVRSPVHGAGSIIGNRNGGPDERGWDGLPRFNTEHTILGYRCACTPYTDHPAYTWIDDRGVERYVPVQREYHQDRWTPAPTTPAVVVDPFVGTGTTVAVAHHLGRHGIGTDLSADYLRLAEWRCTSDDGLRDKVLERAGLPEAPKIRGQLSLLEGGW